MTPAVSDETAPGHRGNPDEFRGAVRNLCFAGPLPPPTHGMANVNLMMVERLAERVPVKSFVVTGADRRGIQGHAIKGLRAIAAAFGIFLCGLRGSKVFYGSVDDGWGGLYTSAFAFAARLTGMRIYLHHHSFRYVDRTTVVMRLLTYAAGRSARHIVLCGCMGELLRRRYRHVANVVVTPNGVAVDGTGTARLRTDGKVVTLGLLSNLTFGKGLKPFIELVRTCSEQGLPVRGVLAGPFTDTKAETYFRAAEADLGEALTWRGPLYGEAKAEFFRTLDVFVFPTRTDAYPLVIVEALLHGCPVISTDRGCIGEFDRLESCTVIGRDADFCREALPVVQRLAGARDQLGSAQELAALEGASLNRANLEATSALVEMLLGAAE